MKIGILEIYLKMKVLKIRFENWNFESYLKTGVWKIIKILRNKKRTNDYWDRVPR